MTGRKAEAHINLACEVVYMSGDVLVYDDDCGFCTWWANYFGHRADL